jgi:predicted PurR-regulated permease PerM
MSFYAIIDTDHIGQKLIDILEAYLPKKIAVKTVRTLALMDDAIKKYLVSKSYTCIILGILVTLSTYLVNLITPLNIPYAVLMGFLIALANFIPYIGFFFGTLPCVLIAAFSGFGEAIGIFIIINVTQQIDNLIVSPKIIGGKVGVKPFWVLVSVIIGGSLFGIVGMIIAIPVISVILRLIEEHVEDHKKASITAESADIDAIDTESADVDAIDTESANV